MPKPIFQLVYLSHAVEDISYTDIRDILDVSRAHNAKEDITGVLIYREGYFLQVLEGNKESVLKLVAKIKDDDRNFKLRVLLEADSPVRLFADWSMAFLDGDIQANSTVDLIELFELCLKSGMSDKVVIQTMVRKFRASAPEFK
ncbi:BLUF domain-containing protein [Bdellovibrio svalbardensis]|uniref:BLUF domain-containing protein n=1 Tax=Bdellovibrio svalbardensis TaxID=2972972 RepID=A0ABT6DJ05_9BACT|nr:BLUF domain-containing protein [Bdellovibrio svalbardensis]MDG0816810.1 BLUF domain-containing protein [Bdellovibrio svalbardensis]